METSTAPLLVRPRPTADLVMRRLLRIPDDPRGTVASAQSAFSRSIAVSAARCTLTYVVLPFLAPAAGFAAGVGPVVGLVIGVAALVSNVVSMRRFWLAEHRWRWGYTFIAVAVMGLVAALVAADVSQLLS